MAISDKLKELQKEGQPQTLDELFQGSKEAVLLDKVKNAVNILIPQMRETIKSELKTELADEVKQQVSTIKVRDGRDGQSPDPQEIVQKVLTLIPTPKDGKDGKDATIDKEEIIAEISKRIPRKGGGGGGSTVISEDLSSQVTGSTRSFVTTRRIGTPILLVSSQFPIPFRPTVDYTAVTNSVNIDSSIPFIASGQTLIFIFVASD